MLIKKSFYQYKDKINFNQLGFMFISNEFKDFEEKLKKLGYEIKLSRDEYDDDGFLKSIKKTIVYYMNYSTNSTIELHFIKNTGTMYVKLYNINENKTKMIIDDLFKSIETYENNKNGGKEMTLDELSIWFNENWFVLKDVVLLGVMFILMFGNY